MKVKKIEPVGFCAGVKRAINIVLSSLKDESILKPIYLLGTLIHNEKTLNALKAKGVIMLENAPHLELIETIKNGTIITTAHGVTKDVINKIREKGIHHIDTTCPYIKQIEELILNKLNENYLVLLYGIKHHPEANFLTGLDDKIVLITDKTEITELNFTNYSKIILTNQTTVSYLKVLMLYQKLKKYIPNLELAEEVCNASRIRQAALPDELNDVDLVLIVGDKTSNNTKTLFALAKKHIEKTYLISELNDLKTISIDKNAKIAIASGTSVSITIVNEIYSHLKNDITNYISNLVDDDYLI
jgi:4-hydroxy-3-methylbut-2-enyl diphosphate reductase